jgi:hypothetical protein
MFLVHPTITPEQMAAYAKAVRAIAVSAVVISLFLCVYGHKPLVVEAFAIRSLQ